MKTYRYLYGTDLAGAYEEIYRSPDLMAYLRDEKQILGVDHTLDMVRGLFAFDKLNGYGQHSKKSIPLVVQYMPMLKQKLGIWGVGGAANAGNEGVWADLANNTGRSTTYTQLELFDLDAAAGTRFYNHLDILFGMEQLQDQDVVDARNRRRDMGKDIRIEQVAPVMQQMDKEHILAAAEALYSGKNVIFHLERGAPFPYRSRELLIQLYSMLPPQFAKEIGYSSYCRADTVKDLAAQQFRVFVIPGEEPLDPGNYPKLQYLVLDMASRCKAGSSQMWNVLNQWWDMPWAERVEVLRHQFRDSEQLGQTRDPAKFISISQNYFGMLESFHNWKAQKTHIPSGVTMEDLVAEYSSYSFWDDVPGAREDFARWSMAVLGGREALQELTEKSFAEWAMGTDQATQTKARRNYNLGSQLCSPRGSGMQKGIQGKIDAKVQAECALAMAAKNAEIAELKTTHANAITKLNTDHDDAITELNKNHDDAITELNTNHKNEITKLKTDHKNEITKLKTNHENAITKLKTDHDVVIEKLKEDHAEEVKGLKKQIGEKDTKMEGLNDTIGKKDTEIEGLNDTIGKKDTEIGGLKNTIVEKGTEIEGLKNTIVEKDTEINSLRAELGELRVMLSGNNAAKRLEWLVSIPILGLGVKALVDHRFGKEEEHTPAEESADDDTNSDSINPTVDPAPVGSEEEATPDGEPVDGSTESDMIDPTVTPAPVGSEEEATPDGDSVDGSTESDRIDPTVDPAPVGSEEEAPPDGDSVDGNSGSDMPPSANDPSGEEGKESNDSNDPVDPKKDGETHTSEGPKLNWRKWVLPAVITLFAAVMAVIVILMFRNPESTPTPSDPTITTTAATAVPYNIYHVVSGSQNGGTVEVSSASAKAGETVTVTITPADGWQLKAPKLENGTTLRNVKENVYTFVMPEHDVTIEVEFSEIETEPIKPEPGERKFELTQELAHEITNEFGVSMRTEGWDEFFTEETGLVPEALFAKGKASDGKLPSNYVLVLKEAPANFDDLYAYIGYGDLHIAVNLAPRGNDAAMDLAFDIFRKLVATAKYPEGIQFRARLDREKPPVDLAFTYNKVGPEWYMHLESWKSGSSTESYQKDHSLEDRPYAVVEGEGWTIAYVPSSNFDTPESQEMLKNDYDECQSMEATWVLYLIDDAPSD